MTEAKAKRGWNARDIALTLLVVLMLAAVAALRAIYTPYRIPSASMVPTLMEGETVAAHNGGRDALHVGDVVFYSEISRVSGRRETYVRRVLALAGQRIAFRDGVPILDGVAARQIATRKVGPEGERIMQETLGARSYRVAYQREGSPALRDMQERLVGRGRVFLVGDARDNALDSRIDGPAPVSGINQSGGWIIFSPVSGRAGHRIE